MPPMPPICGKTLNKEDRTAWKQAIVLLLGVKFRNGLDEKGVAGAVEKALVNHRPQAQCEDCGMMVRGKRGCQLSGGLSGWSGPVGLAIPKPARPPLRTQFTVSHHGT